MCTKRVCALFFRVPMSIRNLQRISIENLTKNGFATLPIRNEDEQQIIEKVFEHIGGFTSFRFPPIEERGVYTEEIRDVFRLFFRVAVHVLEQILHTLDKTTDVERILLQCEQAKTLLLFSDPNEPLSSTDPLAGTFFNLFHYDHGCLNTHRDRYLVTVICAKPAKTAQEGQNLAHSALWVRSPSSGVWRNVDLLLTEPTWIVFVGEECTRICSDAGYNIHASEHCIRLNPDGEYISHSHHQPDPESLPVGNRRSIAMVLGERYG